MTKLLLLLLLTLSLNAKALVYKISSENSSIFIGGTIHVLSEHNYPLKQEYHYAFTHSDILYLETDLGATSSPQFSQKIIAKLSYTPPKTLKDDLNSTSLQALKAYTSAHKIPLESLMRFKVGMSVMNILMSSLKELKIDAMGVDEFFYIKAKESKKQIAFLESVDAQIDLITSMGENQEDEMILSTLNDAKNLKSEMYSIIEHWQNADVNALEKELLFELQDEYPKLYKELLVDRNNKWMKQIISMFNSKKIEYILVGSMHLIGKDGLLHQLREKGYKVELLNTSK